MAKVGDKDDQRIKEKASVWPKKGAVNTPQGTPQGKKEEEE